MKGRPQASGGSISSHEVQTGGEVLIEVAERRSRLMREMSWMELKG